MTFNQFVRRLSKTLWEIVVTEISIRKMRLKARGYRLQTWYWKYQTIRLREKRYQQELKALDLHSCEIAGRTYYLPEDLAKLKALNLKYGRT